MVKFLSSIQFQRAEWNSRMRTFSNHLATVESSRCVHGYWLKTGHEKAGIDSLNGEIQLFSGEINQFIILDQNKIYKRKNSIGQWVYRKWKSADYQSLERL